MTRSLRCLGLAALCALWAASAGAQTPSATTTTSVQSWNPNLVLGRTRRRLGRRRRPSSATLDCGLFRPARSSATVSGRSAATGAARTTSRASATSAMSPARSPSASRTARRLFGSFLVDTRIDRDLRPLFIDNADVGGIVDRDPRVHQGWTGDNVGDFYLGAKINLWSEFRQHPAALAVPRDGEAADGRRATWASRPGRPISGSTSSAARNSGGASSCRGMRATKSGASPTASTFRAGRSGGAWGRASRRGPPCAPRSNWSGRSPTTTSATIASGPGGRRRRQRSRRRSRRPRT